MSALSPDKADTRTKYFCNVLKLLAYVVKKKVSKIKDT